MKGNGLSIAPVQLTTLTKQLTHIFLNLLIMHPKLQRPSMDAGLLSLFHSLSANFFNVLGLNINFAEYQFNILVIVV